MITVVIVFLLFLILGMPVAFVVALAGASFFLSHPDLPPAIVVQRMLSPSQNFTMLAVPLFIFAGNLMNSTGITKRLIKFATVLTGHMYGNIAQLSCVLSTLMSGVSGSANADAAMSCRILGPEMTKRGYARGYSAAVNGFTALIVATIPPSMGLIIYGSVGEVSIGRLFVAGFVPGLLMMVLLMIVIRFTSKRRGYMPDRDKPASLKEIGRASIDGIWALLFPVILIAGLRFGLFTPSESGAFACVYAIIVGKFIFKELTLKVFIQTLKNSGRDIGVIMFLICVSGILGYGIVYDNVPQSLSFFLVGITANPYVMLLIVAVLLVAVGLFIESTIVTLLMTPILLPVVTRLGVDPVQFGLIMMTVTTMGIMTPPVGIALFTTSTILECKPEETVKESLPFMLAVLSVVAFCIFFQDAVLFLPNLVFGVQ